MLGDVRAAAHVAHRVVQALAKALQQVGADQLPIGRTDAIAATRIGHAIALRLDVTDREVAIDRDAHPHVVHRLAGRTHAGQQRRVVVLDVDEVPLDVEQSVVALPSLRM